LRFKPRARPHRHIRFMVGRVQPRHPVQMVIRLRKHAFGRITGHSEATGWAIARPRFSRPAAPTTLGIQTLRSRLAKYGVYRHGYPGLNTESLDVRPICAMLAMLLFFPSLSSW
jgi:hypothetical protein